MNLKSNSLKLRRIWI